MMNKMKMSGKKVTSTVSISNPIQLLKSFTPLSETSLIEQTTTTLTIAGQNLAAVVASNPIFSLLVTCIIYAPGKPRPITCSDNTPPAPDGSPGQTRTYQQIFSTNFGQGYRMVSFILNGVAPVVGKLNIVIAHPPSKRRIVFCDEFANLDTSKKVPLDQLAIKTSKMARQGLISVQTKIISQSNELIYGVIGLGGSFNNFLAPVSFLAIQDVGTNIDKFDATLKTFYKLSSSMDSFTMNASSTGNNFSWGAALFTLRAG